MARGLNQRKRSPTQPYNRTDTEHKRLEDQPAWQTNVLKTVMANTGAMLVYLDRNFNFVMANKAYIDACGHTWEEIEGRNHFNFFPNEENEAIFRQVRDTGKKVSFRDKPFEYANQPWRGVTYWDWTLVPVKEDSNEVVIGLVLSLIETTERKKMEEALRRSEELYRKYFELGLVGMAIESPTGQWIEVNDRLCEIYGYPCDELMKKHWKDFTHPEDLDSDLEYFQQLQRGEIDRYSIEKRYIRKDGEIINCIISIGCRRHPSRELAHVYALVVDITSLRRTEEHLRRAKDELEVRVKKRTRELRELAHRLVDTQEKERAAIGSALHDEIGQSLTYTTLLIDRALRKPDQQMLAEAKSTAQEAISKIRDLSSILSPRQLRSAGLIQAMTTMVEEYAQRTKVKVDFDHSNGLDEVPEEVALASYRIVQESLTNTVRHARASEVKVRLSREQGNLHLEVRDNGIGFDPEAVKKSTGLTGIRERAQALGGDFSIESDPGKGTLVLADLPLSARETA
ncbi:MAG: PAS domain S-box protein [Dehalococcoidia bacterium]|nr:PAS domain S-box protein [Dehalococcoidia bacterium]